MSHRSFKDRIYAEFARVGTALASDRRLELLDLLAQGPRYVDALASEMEMSVANISQHLQVLRAAKLVEAERRGTRVQYRLADESVLRLWLNLRSVAEHRLPELGELRREQALDGQDALTYDELEALIQAGDAVLLDVRPWLEFESGHLPGAINVPVEDLEHRADELPRQKRIVAYCRGSYCLFADEAVALLRSRGFDAVRLAEGWPEWAVKTAAIESPS
jgi:rhodanese-related sulfurtransferase